MIPDPILTAKYWQWILGIPKDENPLATGKTNNDKFLALPCTGGGEDCDRTLGLSEGDMARSILIPIYCAEYCTAEVIDHNPTDQRLLQILRDDVCSPLFMECVLDEQPLEPYYIESPPFEITVPYDNMLDGNPPAGTYRAIAAGYWHLLSPLPRGKHLVRFGGTGRNGFHTKVQYTIDTP